MSQQTTKNDATRTELSSSTTTPNKADPPTKSKSTAKKSTTPTPELLTRSTHTRRLAALASKNKQLINSGLNDFNPDTSNREKRKMERKLKTKTPTGAAFDSKGKHLGSGLSMCDCLDSTCNGCFFPCKKCFSPKCGPDCRNNRKIIYESVEFHGFSYVKYNPVEK